MMNSQLLAWCQRKDGVEMYTPCIQEEDELSEGSLRVESREWKNVQIPILTFILTISPCHSNESGTFKFVPSSQKNLVYS